MLVEPFERTQMAPEILDTHIIYQQNSFAIVRRWLRGAHPNLGVITWGWTGFETIQEKCIIRPIQSFIVEFQ
jgi:hypothetical protein